MRSLRWLFLLVGLLFMGGVWYFFYHQHASSDAGDASRAKSAANPQSAGRAVAVPVVPGVVQKRNVPIYFDGIGTVQAFNTVAIHPQISGTLTQVLFKEGQDVKKGDLLGVIDPRPLQAQLDGAVAKKAEDVAQLSNNKVLLARDTDLFKKGAIDNQTYDTQRYLVDQLVATVAADQATIDNAQTQLSYTQLTAPIDGRCGIRQVDQGNYLTPASTLVVVTQLKPISVIFTLPQQDVLTVNEAFAKGSLTVTALDSTMSKVLDTGALSVVNNQIDTTTGTVQLKATFANEALRLWPGQFVNNRVLVATRQNGLVVPAAVIQRGPDGTYAYVITKDQHAEMRPVRVEQIDGGLALINSGLEAGEQVVVDGQYKLQPGAPVIITAPKQPGDGRRLTAADETVAPNQSVPRKQAPGPEEAGHNQERPQASEQPEGSSPPAMATQG
jgi:membrane fusion protein, multidrug efflux system